MIEAASSPPVLGAFDRIAAHMTADPLSLRIVVSTVSYGGSDLILAGLPALLEELSRFAEGAVILVDNDSPDGDGDRLAEGLAAMGSPPQVRLVRSPVNGGFAAGNNLAFRATEELPWRPDAVLLLNPDSEIRPGAIEELARVMLARPRVGVVGARLENEDGSSWVAAFHFPTIMREFSRELRVGLVDRRWPMLIADSERPVQADWVSGACMLINARALEEVGSFDEDYFLYFEEIDYQLQLRRAGWEIWHAPDARVMHIAGTATGIVNGVVTLRRMPDYWFTSWRRYFEKNHGALYARAAAAARLAGLLLGRLQRGLRGKQAHEDPPGFVGDFFRRCLLAAAPRPPASSR